MWMIPDRTLQAREKLLGKLPVTGEQLQLPTRDSANVAPSMTGQACRVRTLALQQATPAGCILTEVVGLSTLGAAMHGRRPSEGRSKHAGVWCDCQRGLYRRRRL